MKGAGMALLPRPREAGVVEGTWEGSAAASGLSDLGYTREREQEKEPLLGYGMRWEVPGAHCLGNPCLG